MQKIHETQHPRRFLTRRYLLLALTIVILAGMVLTYQYHRTQQIPASAYTSGALYYAGIQNGHVVIFDSDQKTPVLTTNIRSASLPQADRDALQKKITLRNQEALAHFLEDYGS